MDGVDPVLVDTAEAALAAEPGVTGVRSVKMRWIGHRLYGARRTQRDHSHGHGQNDGPDRLLPQLKHVDDSNQKGSH